MSRVSIIFGKHMFKEKAGGDTQVFFAFIFIKKNIIIIFICLYNICVMAAPVAEWVRSLYFSALNQSIISPLCLV